MKLLTRFYLIVLAIIAVGVVTVASGEILTAAPPIDTGRPGTVAAGDDDDDDDDGGGTGRCRGEFEDLSLHVVYSSSDLDAQILIEGGSDDPLLHVRASGPGGTRPIVWRSRDGSRLGFADFGFETPEPSLNALMQAYPAGDYDFVGRTVSRVTVCGTSELSYDLLPAPEIIYPVDGDTGIPVNGLVAFWNAVPGAEALRLELEDEEEEVAFKVDLPGDADSFEFPNDWLQPDTEYTLDVKAIGENGNVTVTDLRFTSEE